MELPSNTITLTVTLEQLQAIERGISAELRELAQQPPALSNDRTRSLLWDMREQIDRLLTEKAAAFRAYDEAYRAQADAGNP